MNDGLDRRSRMVTVLEEDLDFHQHTSSYATHNLHAFPAKFPPQLPRKFIDVLTEPHESLLDPMMGSGTTVLEGDLANRRLAVEWGSDADAEGRRLRTRLPGLELASYTTPAEALQAVLDGEADAALVDGVTARQFVAAGASDGQARIVEPALISAPYVIAMPIKARALQHEVNEALQTMRLDGSLQQLEDRWFLSP